MPPTRNRDDVAVGRSYTRSRRLPRMFGRMPGRDGHFLPGGPYTLTQGGLFLVLLLVVWKLPVVDWLGPARWCIPLVAVFVRRARIESRTPLGWLLGCLAAITAPAAGTRAGRPFRADRPVRTQPRIWLHEHPAGDTAARTAASPLQQLLERAQGSETSGGA